MPASVGIIVAIVAIIVVPVIILMYMMTPSTSASVPSSTYPSTPAYTSPTPTTQPIYTPVPTFPNIATGQAVSCGSGDPKGAGSGTIYRYLGNGQLSWYPSPAVASSWDPTWGSFMKIPCDNMTLGPDMTLNVASSVGLGVGQPIRCASGDPMNQAGVNIYRYMGNNTIDWYPSQAIAASWDPNYNITKSIDCTGMTQGPNIKMHV